MSRSFTIAITNVFGPLNRGDFALFQQLLSAVRVGDHSASIVAIARDPDECSIHFPDVHFMPQPGVAVNSSGPLRVLATVVRCIVLMVASFWPNAANLLPSEQRKSLQAIQQADLVIGCAGGYLTASSWSYYPQVAQVMFASRQAQRYIMAPASVGPVQGTFQERLLKEALKHADLILVRESQSAALCRALGFNYRLVGDLAFTMPLNLDGPVFREDYICATVVRWTFPSSSDRHLAQETYIAALAAALDNLSLLLQADVKLLLQVDNDRGVSEEVLGRMERPAEIVRCATPDDYLQILQRSRLMVASRFHSAVFSIIAECPTVAVSYLPKASAMMNDVGLSEIVVQIEKTSRENILSAAEASLHTVDWTRARQRLQSQGWVGRELLADYIKECIS